MELPSHSIEHVECHPNEAIGKHLCRGPFLGRVGRTNQLAGDGSHSQ